MVNLSEVKTQTLYKLLVHLMTVFKYQSEQCEPMPGLCTGWFFLHDQIR